MARRSCLLLLLFLLSASAAANQVERFENVRQFCLQSFHLSISRVEKDPSLLARWRPALQGANSSAIRVTTIPGAFVKNFRMESLNFGIKKFAVVPHPAGWLVLSLLLQTSGIAMTGLLTTPNTTAAGKRFYYSLLFHDRAFKVALHKKRGHFESSEFAPDKSPHKDRKPLSSFLALQGDLAIQSFAPQLEDFLVHTALRAFELGLLRLLHADLARRLRHTPAALIEEGHRGPQGARVPRRANNRINAYADAVLRSMQPALRRLDPLALPDLSEAFSTQIFLLPLHLQMNFTEGKLFGLSRIYRSGDVLLSGKGLKLTFHVPLAIHNLRQSYRGRVTIGNRTEGVNVTSMARHLQATFVLEQDLFGPSQPVIKAVKVTKLGPFEIRIQGFGPVDWLLSRLGSALVNIVRWNVVDKVEELLLSILNQHAMPRL